MKTRTLDDPGARDAAPVVDHLYVVLCGGRPTGGVRWALGGIDRVDIGRGDTRVARRDGTTLRVDCPDPWMSSVHVRFEREGAHWAIADAGSRNGMLVNGVKHARMVVGPTDVVEVGRSFFMLREGEHAGAAALDLAVPTGDPLATLDPVLAARFDELARIATSGIPIVIGGPTGSGKERIARAIHVASRRSGALVAVNCGALPAGLVESELFGHRRGAFSGAIADHAGLVVAADGGTLFLDEIGDLPAPAQAALLRVLEEHEVRAVGATIPTKVDLRVVAASHRDLHELVETGVFREDLLARLAGFELDLPALAERRVDLGVMLAEIAPSTMTYGAAWARRLFAYAWPRNVRELVQVVDRSVALAGAAELAPEHLPDEIAQATFAARTPAEPDSRRDELVALLIKHHGNVTKIAAELGHVRQQIQRWLKRYGLDPARYRP